MQILAATRIFADNYQLVICDDVMAFTEESNWCEGDVDRGFSGNDRFRMVGTEADLNDHWVEVAYADEPPSLEPWQRVICLSLSCNTGEIHIMSLIDDEPSISLNLPKGDYSVFVAGCNMGIDQSSLDEDDELTDEQLAARKDLEWYRIFVVPGQPVQQGRIKDE